MRNGHIRDQGGGAVLTERLKHVRHGRLQHQSPEYNEVRTKRVDTRIVDHQAKTVTTLEMSSPWIQNREKKDEEKVLKYGPLRWERKLQFKGYNRTTQYNIIIYVFGGWSSSMEGSLTQLLGKKGKDTLKRMQRPIISSSLNISRTFKVVGTNIVQTSF